MKCDVDEQGRRIPRLCELRKILKENLVVMYYHCLNDWDKEVKALEAEIKELRDASRKVVDARHYHGDDGWDKLKDAICDLEGKVGRS